MHGLTLLTAPTGEPVELAEVKEWCAVAEDDDSEDRLFRRLLARAREFAEERTGRQLVSAQWRLTLDGFPAEIRLPRPPLQAVVQVRYYDSTDTLTTLDAADYVVDVARQPGTIRPVYGTCWPGTYCRPDAVLVDFWAGYGPVTSVPAGAAAGSTTVTPGVMSGIYAGSVLRVGVPEAEETVVVSAVASTTFTATFARTHVGEMPVAPGLPLRVLQAIEMLVVHWHEWRGDELTREAEAATEAAERLLRSAWTGEYV